MRSDLTRLLTVDPTDSVIVTLPTPYGPLYLAGLASNFGDDPFAAEREELVLRSAWLSVGEVGSDRFGAECERLRALAGVS